MLCTSFPSPVQLFALSSIYFCSFILEKSASNTQRPLADHMCLCRCDPADQHPCDSAQKRIHFNLYKLISYQC